MAITRTDTTQRLSQCVKHGSTVYIAGQVPLQTRGKSITEQTTEVLQSLEKYLLSSGSDKDHMLYATVWLSDLKDFAEFNAVWDVWVPEGKAPARACVEAKLVAPDFNVEVALVAAVKE